MFAINIKLTEIKKYCSQVLNEIVTFFNQILVKMQKPNNQNPFYRPTKKGVFSSLLNFKKNCENMKKNKIIV